MNHQQAGPLMLAHFRHHRAGPEWESKKHDMPAMFSRGLD